MVVKLSRQPAQPSEPRPSGSGFAGGPRPSTAPLRSRLGFQSQLGSPAARRGFSLIEVLLAVFILGIGLIMVAAVFPVGANWTRQTTESSVAQTIVQDAITVIKIHYGPTGDLHNLPGAGGGPHALDADFLIGVPQKNGTTLLEPNRSINQNSILQATYYGSPFVLQPLPFFTSIPASERSYQFGADNPFPAKNPAACTYFWTAIGRLDPTCRNPNSPAKDPANDILLAPSYKYDIYILVFRKGAAEQNFSVNFNMEMPGTRINAGSSGLETFIPSVYRTSPGAATLPPGSIGIGQVSGTVFHVVLNQLGNAVPSPPIATNASGAPESVIWSPPADGTSASPLIYVYQTTLTF